MIGATIACALVGLTHEAAAAGLIPSQGEIVREGTLLDGPCSSTPPPVEDVSNWGADKDGTPYVGMDVHTEFYEVDSQGEVSHEPIGTLFWFALPKPAHCVYDQSSLIHGIKAVDRGIWVMRVHHVRINKIFDSTSMNGWGPSAAGDGVDAVTEIRFEVVGPNTCGNSAWVGLGPTDPACIRQNQKKAAADSAKQEQQELPIRHADYRSMCSLGKLKATSYQDGTPGACIGYLLSIMSEESEMQANQRIAHDPPNPDYMTVTAPHAPAQPQLAKLPAQWSAYRAVLSDMGWVVADLQAMVADVERANGAYAATAKNPAADQWTQRQNQAARDAMNDAANRIGDAENNLPQARSELIAADIPQATVDKLIDMETQRVNRADTLIELLR
jgi:hypothetical protein